MRLCDADLTPNLAAVTPDASVLPPERDVG